jgi:hypothetical protein
MKEYDEVIQRLTDHLTGQRKETATSSVQTVLAELDKLKSRYGNPFDIDYRTLSDKTGLNLKRIQKWVNPAQLRNAAAGL